MSLTYRRFLCVAFFADGSLYPNLGDKVQPTEAGSLYWMNMVVMFASAKKMATQPLNFRLYTNVQPVGPVGDQLLRLGVEVVQVPYSFQPPESYHNAFSGSFYVFDVMKHFSETGQADDQVLVIDPDCVWLGDPLQCFNLLNQHDMIGFNTQFPAEWPSNGHSRQSLQDIARSEGADIRLPDYFGGEFIGFTVGKINIVLADIKASWNKSLNWWREKKPKFNTEEHLWSYVIAVKNLDVYDAHEYVQRLWTSHSYRNTSPENFSLTLWHLPGEKTRGIRNLYDEIQNPDAVFYTSQGNGYKTHLGNILGVTPSLTRKGVEGLKRTLLSVKRLASRNTAQ